MYKKYYEEKRINDYKFKVGDRVKVIRLREGYHNEDTVKFGMTGTVLEEATRPWVEFDEDINGYNTYNGSSRERTMCMYEDEIELYTGSNGIMLLKEIKNGRIKNCDIEVYKNDIYQFTIQCGEKAILDNPKHHIGMLTSNKYTYKPIYKKEMTISEIEKELGYSIKIIKE